VEQALASTRMAEAGYWPSVTGDAGVTASWDSRTDTSVPWSAGVGVSVPLFSGFDTTHAVRRARYDEKAAREQLAGLVSDIQFEVWAARANVVEAAETIRATHKVVAAAEEAVRLAEENYKTGVGTVVEVFDAQGTRASALLQLVQARVGWYVAFARLERAVGTALEGGTAPAGAGGMR
jgi:outer membrane protein TolC